MARERSRDCARAGRGKPRINRARSATARRRRCTRLGRAPGVWLVTLGRHSARRTDHRVNWTPLITRATAITTRSRRTRLHWRSSPTNSRRDHASFWTGPITTTRKIEAARSQTMFEILATFEASPPVGPRVRNELRG